MAAESLMTLVDEIWTRRLSRNKHFLLFDRADYRRALRVKRYLERLADEIVRLSRQGEVEIRVEERDDQGLVLHVEAPHLQIQRRSFLSRQELDLLRRHNQDARALIPQGA